MRAYASPVRSARTAGGAGEVEAAGFLRDTGSPFVGGAPSYALTSREGQCPELHFFPAPLIRQKGYNDPMSAEGEEPL